MVTCQEASPNLTGFLHLPNFSFRTVNPQVPGSSLGRGARIFVRPRAQPLPGWAFCISGARLFAHSGSG